MKGKPTIGLALGAGGARGLAHIPVLQLFDRMGIKPACLAGSSIGAIIGALYASGLSGTDIRRQVASILGGEEDSLLDRWRDRKRLRWLDVFIPEIGRGGLISADRVVNHLQEILKAERFEDLSIPLTILATDYQRGTPLVFNSGELLSPLKGTMAIPGVFAPVPFQDRILMDGGMVDPVPYESLLGRCDVVVAVDVTGVPKRLKKGKMPGFPDALRGAVRIMQRALLAEKMSRKAPDIHIRMNFSDVGILQFGKAAEIYRKAAPGVRRLQQALRPFLSSP